MKLQDPTVETLAAELQRLREEIKEQQPSVIGAIRTFFHDLDAWRNGERDYPRAATLGLVFAYLRPRVVLMFGGFVAIVLAVSQVWMLYRQNGLIAQQNELVVRQNALIDGQSYALRVQTAAALLSGIDDSSEIPPAKLAILNSFGEVGFESLLVLAQSSGKSGDAARNALKARVSTLSPAQAFQVLDVLLDFRMQSYVSRIRAREYADELDRINGNAEHLERIMSRPVSAFDWNKRQEDLAPRRPDPAYLLLAIHHIEQAGHVSFWNPEQRQLLRTKLSMLYVFYLSIGSNEDDGALSNLCRVLRGDSEHISIYQRAYENLERIKNLESSGVIFALTATAYTVGETCGPSFVGPYGFYQAWWTNSGMPNGVQKQLEVVRASLKSDSEIGL